MEPDKDTAKQIEMLERLQQEPEFRIWMEKIGNITSSANVPLDPDVREKVILRMKTHLTDNYNFTFKEHIHEFNKYFHEENILNLEQQQDLIDAAFRDLDDRLFITIQKALYECILLICFTLDYLGRSASSTVSELINSEYFQNMLLVAQLFSLMMSFITYEPLKNFLFTIPGLGHVFRIIDRLRPTLNYLLYIQIIFAGTAQIMQKLSLTRYCSDVIGNIYQTILHTITTGVDTAADEAAVATLDAVEDIYLKVDEKLRDSIWAAAQTCLIQFIGAESVLDKIGRYEHGVDMDMLRRVDMVDMLRDVDKKVSIIPEVVELSNSIWINEEEQSSRTSSSDKTKRRYSPYNLPKPKSLSSNSTSSFLSAISNPDGTINDDIKVESSGIIKSVIYTPYYIDLFEKLSQLSKEKANIGKHDFRIISKQISKYNNPYVIASSISSLERKIDRSHSAPASSKPSYFPGTSSLSRSYTDPDKGGGTKRRTKRRKSKRTKRRIKRRSNRRKRRSSKR